MHHCLSCHGTVTAARLACDSCGLSFEGRFNLPRLARLSPEDQDLAELVLLTGGNLKAAAADMKVSYPTFRKRLDGLIAALRKQREADDRQSQAYLDAVERGAMAPEEAIRLITELKGTA